MNKKVKFLFMKKGTYRFLFSCPDILPCRFDSKSLTLTINIYLCPYTLKIFYKKQKTRPDTLPCEV